MKILIAIPSKNRSDQIVKSVLNWLIFLNYPWKVFVEPQDYDLYKAIIKPQNLVKIDQNNQGLGYVKEKIKEYALEHNFELIFKVDDDIRGWLGKERGSHKKGQAAAQIVEEAIQESIIKFEKYPELAAVVFPYNNEMFEVREWTGINARLQTCYIVKTQDMFADRRFSTFEDFVSFIYLRINNKVTLKYGWAGMYGSKVGKTKGGLQDFDRAKMAEEELNLIRKEIYPALKVKKVVGKTWNFEPDLNNKIFGGKKI